ncbi:sarcosine oxidase subunit gamma [Loktanella ponticola]|uniref:Sarcosine oxidase subunit gamma n=1 Tax=Yoonia ponticola TaxID=1524255 RepID=A0A7W9BKQ4_9RHOB|nr:sarcosine oxidase subunit gamma family protein [Yoonia ponticola]MBB5722131.1 sarcosine oxidase subunit gamma [Yoonia ponticola]
MSNAISALEGRAVAGDVTVTDMGLQGMISLRGDLSDKALTKVCKTVTGADAPKPLQMAVAGPNGFGWMSPDEALLLVPYDAVRDGLTSINNVLSGQHFLASNVSDARAHIVVSGAYADEVIAKVAPVDMHPDSFAIGDFRRSHLGQVAAAFWKSDANTFHVICFRSVAGYVFDLLAASAKAGPVGYTS